MGSIVEHLINGRKVSGNGGRYQDIFNPATGEVTGSIDLQGLLPLPEREPSTDVLNGIAVNPEDGGIWVTGKNWPWMYRIEVRPATAAGSVSR